MHRSLTNSHSRTILFVTIALLCIGNLATYAASALKADLMYGRATFILEKQLLITAFGMFVAAFLQIVPISWLTKMVIPLLILTIFLSVLYFIPGAYNEAGGAMRWITIGSLRFQPSEITKITSIFFLSRILIHRHFHINRISFTLIITLAILLLLYLPLLVQPDFGTFMLLTLVSFGLFYFRGIPRKWVLWSTSLLAISAAALIASQPYRIKRIIGFMDPWSNRQGSGFQLIQSYLAINNGGFLGVGFGESKQKLFYLPEAHTDFILAVIGEESGIFGISLSILLIFFLIQTGFTIAVKVREPFLRFLALGITLLLFVQSFFNIGVVLGLLPTKGISLPFLSAGATSLGVFIFLSGVLARIAQEISDKPHEA